MKTIQLITFALLLSVFSQGCDKGGSPSSEGSGQKRLHIAFVANSPGEYWAVVNLGCSIAAQQLGDVDVDFRYPAETTVEAQQQMITNLLASGIDGIAISPINANEQTDFLNGIAEKTLLVCADSDAQKSKRVSYIGTDNVAAGTQAAELIKEALPEGGKIALFVGYSQAQNTMERIQGIRKGLAGSKVEIVETVEDGQKSATAEKNTGEALKKHADLAGVVGISGYHGPALLKAVREAGKVGQLKIVCFDDNTETLKAIVAGEIYGTVAQKPFQIGKQTVVQMEKFLRGDKAALADGKIFTASRPLNKENVEHHIAQQRNIAVFLSDKSL